MPARDEVLPLQHEGAPDSYRPSGLCPRCGKQSSFESAGSLPVTFDHEVYAAGPGGSREPLLIDRVTSLVRLAGNIGAHFDPMKPMSKENAQELLNFLRELLRYLYELPAELARRRTSSP